MKTNIIQIGNSKGIILPANLLQKSGLTLKSSVTLDLKEDGSIIIKPAPRQGWEEAAKQMAKAGDDELLLQDNFNDEDLDWWEWNEK